MRTPQLAAGVPSDGSPTGDGGVPRVGRIFANDEPPACPHIPVAPVSREAADASTPPMLKHWREVKAQHPETILFYRVGDFYEMFHEDAELAARVLEITLTSRGDGVPLAGVPVKAAAEYLRQLVGAGFRVAICEQVEDPKLAARPGPPRGRRDRHPGRDAAGGLARGCQEQLPGRARGRTGSRGARGDRSQHRRVRARNARSPRASWKRWRGSDRLRSSYLRTWRSRSRTTSSRPCASAGSSIPTWRARSSPGGSPWPRSTGSAWGRRTAPAVGAAGALLRYLTELQPAGLPHLARPLVRRSDAFLWLDEMTRRNLELVEPLRAGARDCTLLETIDATVTPMGGRLLRQWLLSPLRDPAAIEYRLDAVEVAVRDGRGRGPAARGARRRARRRAAGRPRRGGPRHAARARRAPRFVPPSPGCAEALSALAASTLPGGGRAAALADALDELDLLADLASELARGLEDRPPPALADGGVIRAGLRRRARRAARAPGRRQAVHRLAAAARARAHRHLVAQGRLQQGLRLLPRDHQRPRRQGARRTTSGGRRWPPRSAT